MRDFVMYNKKEWLCISVGGNFLLHLKVSLHIVYILKIAWIFSSKF